MNSGRSNSGDCGGDDQMLISRYGSDTFDGIGDNNERNDGGDDAYDDVGRSNQENKNANDNKYHHNTSSNLINSTPLTTNSSAVKVVDVMKQYAMVDRTLLEYGSTAFMSYLRAYKEHLCSYIFRFDQLDIGRYYNHLTLFICLLSFIKRSVHRFIYSNFYSHIYLLIYQSISCIHNFFASIFLFISNYHYLSIRLIIVSTIFNPF